VDADLSLEVTDQCWEEGENTRGRRRAGLRKSFVSFYTAKQKRQNLDTAQSKNIWHTNS